jgi:hypothetical protein
VTKKKLRQFLLFSKKKENGWGRSGEGREAGWEGRERGKE